jgi:hypothetical protein
MKFKISRKLALTVFIWLLVLAVVENPMFQSLNLMFSSTQLTVSNPNINSGLAFQGSCLVSTVVRNVQATNSTSGQLVNAYQVTVIVFNFMSLMLLISPIALYLYFEFNKGIKKESVPKKRIKRKLE